MRDEAMKERREYQHLEEVLKQEKAGSAKIRALAHWLMQENIKWKLEHDCKSNDDRRKLFTKEAYIEYLIFAEGYKEDSADYLTAYEHAFETMKPYIDQFMDEGKLGILLIYLREINREKSKK